MIRFDCFVSALLAFVAGSGMVFFGLSDGRHDSPLLIPVGVFFLVVGLINLKDGLNA